ncbi:uncharacterized protein B0H18DRAFT_669713 [Fomitopsis serialis]|uniref:uncharacterized protein n=1 Tax=Fomitopsis serialis TaxID=139415 RepID=UPI002008AD43|nr:uncharacterized protein B0H18DRAFT_669713 [Neoantrodia serialis]KAH9932863.1 hypothetical protein B0H18DRAFT_669713 [Neoantrodia serialis]
MVMVSRRYAGVANALEELGDDPEETRGRTHGVQGAVNVHDRCAQPCPGMTHSPRSRSRGDEDIISILSLSSEVRRATIYDNSVITHLLSSHAIRDYMEMVGGISSQYVKVSVTPSYSRTAGEGPSRNGGSAEECTRSSFPPGKRTCDRCHGMGFNSNIAVFAVKLCAEYDRVGLHPSTIGGRRRRSLSRRIRAHGSKLSEPDESLPAL